MGTPAVAAVPVGGMSVEQGGVPPGQEPCGCSAGWVLFGVSVIRGMVMVMALWHVGALGQCLNCDEWQQAVGQEHTEQLCL